MCIKAVCQPRSVGGLGNPATLKGARGSKSHSAFLSLQTPLRGLLLFPVFPQALLIISPLSSSLALLSTGDAAGAGNAFQLYTSASCLQSPTDTTHLHAPRHRGRQGTDSSGGFGVSPFVHPCVLRGCTSLHIHLPCCRATEHLIKVKKILRTLKQ